MKTLAVPILMLAALASCQSTASGRYLQYSGVVRVTAQQTAGALRAGTIDVSAAREIRDVLKAADAALDAYAIAVESGAGDTTALWDAVDAAMARLAPLVERWLR